MNELVKNGAFVSGNFNVAPGSGLNTVGALGPGAAFVTHCVPTIGCAGGFGLYRDGGTPKSGLNFAGDAGGELLVMN